MNDENKLLEEGKGEKKEPDLQSNKEQDIWIGWLKKRITLTHHQEDLIKFALKEKDKEIEHLKAQLSKMEGEKVESNYSVLIGKQVRYRYIDWEEGSFTPWLELKEKDLHIFEDASIDILQFKP